MVVDRLGVARAAVPEPTGDTAPARRHLLRRRCDRPQVLDTDGADDLRHHPRRRPGEFEAVGERLQQFVGITGVNTADVEVAGDVGASQTQVAEAVAR